MGESVEYFADDVCAVFCDTYVNVYCFQCNHPKGTNVQAQCNRIDITEVQKNDLKCIPFSALLTARPEPANKNTGCTIGEFLDPLHMTCTRLHCPVGTAAQYGSCAPIVEEELGYTVYLSMELVLDDSATNTNASANRSATLDPSDLPLADIIQDVARIVMRRVNTRATACGLCSVDIVEDTRTGKLYTTADLISTSSCRPVALLKGLSRLFIYSEILSVVLPSTKHLASPLKLKHARDAPNTHWDAHGKLLLLDVFTGKFCIQGTQFIANETIVCPSIGISFEDMRVLGRNGSAFDMISSRSMDVGNGTSRVCVDDYINILRINGLVSGEGRQATPTLFAIGITTLLSIMSNNQ